MIGAFAGAIAVAESDHHRYRCETALNQPSEEVRKSVSPKPTPYAGMDNGGRRVRAVIKQRVATANHGPPIAQDRAQPSTAKTRVPRRRGPREILRRSGWKIESR